MVDSGESEGEDDEIEDDMDPDAEKRKKEGFWASVWNFGVSIPTLVGT